MVGDDTAIANPGTGVRAGGGPFGAWRGPPGVSKRTAGECGPSRSKRQAWRISLQGSGEPFRLGTGNPKDKDNERADARL